jgi:hypothetical protein
MPDIRVRFEWQPAGAVALTDGKPSFPNVSAKPGVWRVMIGETAYHGATRDLRATMYQLTAPGPTQTTNQRVHNAALAGLKDRKPVNLAVVTAAEGKAGDGWFPLDLDSDDVRSLLKAATAITVEQSDPDPDSATYRAALNTAQQVVTALAESDLMRSTPAGKPTKPRNDEVQLMRQASTALIDLVDEHDRYWFTRWGHEGNPTDRRRPATAIARTTPSDHPEVHHKEDVAVMADFDAVWARIVAHAGELFETKTGKPFGYRIEHGQLVPTHTKRQIPRSDFAKALALMPLEGPGQIRDLVQGSAYVYGILKDRRIRP